MTTPTIGRIVLVQLKEAGKPLVVNGSDEHPAIVTAVHGNLMINCRVLQDGPGEPLWQTSVPSAGMVDEGYLGSTWRWPPREG